jgi:hypothetical protein
MNTPRWLLSLLCTRPELRPGRALLTPTWLAALAVLGVNDHLLKGAGLLPGVVTGKLSDFAGMLVAPVLLAALLGLRSRRGLLLANLAIAAVFAAIKLSPAAADAWSWLMGLVGMPWVITVDPTDLLALPALALGWRVLMPAMRSSQPVFQPLRQRYAQAMAISTGTLLCVATSPPPHADEGDWGEADSGFDTDTDTGIEYQSIDADVYLSNNTTQDIILRTRDLLPEIQLDCLAVADDPGLLLSESLFDAGRTWTMPPTTNAAARDLTTATRDCYAVRVEGDTLSEPLVLFWSAAEIPVVTIVGDIDDPSQHTSGAVILAADADGRISVQEAKSEIVFPAELIPPADAYYPGPDVARLAWTNPPVTTDALQLTALDQGPDGCIGIEFDGGAAFPRWYFCPPTDAFPFALDEWVTVGSFADGDVVTLTRVPDPQTQEPVPTIELVASRGRELPKLAATVLAAKIDYNPSLAPDPVCGTVARPKPVSARYEDGPAEAIKAGETVTLMGVDSSLSLWVAHAEERVVLNPVCAEGPDELGPDLEIVAVRVPQNP